MSIYGADSDEEKDYSVSSQNDNPENIMLSKERLEQIEQALETELSLLERQVVQLRMTGMGYDEISRILGRDSKSVDNALQRIKNKMKKYMDC